MAKLLPHIPSDTPAEAFLEPVDLAEANRDALRDDDTVDSFLAGLIQRDELIDAVRVLARALHPQYAVAWALECASENPPNEVPKKQRIEAHLLDLAEQWLKEPGDTPLRRQAMVDAEESGYRSPHAWVAAAIGWSGGSIAPETAPPVEPPEGLCGRAAAGAINITAVREPAKIMDHTKRYLELGLQYAQSEPPQQGVGPTPTITPSAVFNDPETGQAVPGEEPASDEPIRVRSLRRPAGETSDPPAPNDTPASPSPSPSSGQRRSLRRRT